MSVSTLTASVPNPAVPADASVGPASPPRLGLLGGWALEWAGTHDVLPSAARRLIAYIALRGGAARAEVAGTLWPEVSEPRANGSLRSTIWRVHKQRPELLRDVGGMLSLSPAVTVDVIEFATAARQLIDVRAPVIDDQLMTRSTGDLLPGWYEDWVVFERERLRQLRLHALEVLAVALCNQHRHAEALDVAIDALAIEPLRESAHRAIVRIHLAEGNAVEALRAYRECRRLLATELGVAPSPRLQQMVADAGLRDVD